MKKKCLILCYTQLANDPRVLKHYAALREDYSVTTAGVSPLGADVPHITISETAYWDELLAGRNALLGGTMIRLINFVRFRMFGKFYHMRYWNRERKNSYRRIRSAGPFDLIVANDLNTLPLACKLKTDRTKLVFDAHEYHPAEYAERPFWRKYYQPLIEYMLRKHLVQADRRITVSDNIAAKYLSEFGTDFSVILNAPPYLAVKPSGVGGKTKIVYSGMWGPNRNFDELLQMIGQLPEHELHFLIVNPNEAFRSQAAPYKNVFFHPAVAVHEVPLFLSRFDIGVHLMKPSNFNNDNALPNKYFQYMQARLVTAFGPLSEISGYTAKYKTGIIAADFSGRAMADAIRGLSPAEIASCKERNDANARQFCEEREVARLMEIYRSLNLN